MMASENQELVLLDFWASVFCMRVKIALAEKGIADYGCKEENIKVAKSALLMQMNPIHKKIPVLIHNGKPICESLIIVEYIDEVWKDKSPLLPSDPYQRSHARFWADFVNKKIYPNINKLQMSEGEEAEIGKNELIEALKMLEKELGDQAYFGGETFGLVDIALIGFYSRFYTVETFGGFTLETECPTLVAWAKRCIARESVSRSLPDPQKVLEFSLQLKKQLAID